jgi:hypothetical protein
MTTTLQTLNLPIDQAVELAESLIVHTRHLDNLLDTLQHQQRDLTELIAGVDAAVISATLDGNGQNNHIYLRHIDNLETTLSVKKQDVSNTIDEANQYFAKSTALKGSIASLGATLPGIETLPPVAIAFTKFRETVKRFVEAFE